MEKITPNLLRDAYHSILELGLENLQRCGSPDLNGYLRIEIDHLHNIPSYMHCENLFRHAYYYCSERPFYLERVVAIPGISVDFMLSRYAPHWDAIRNALAPYSDVINDRHYPERL